MRAADRDLVTDVCALGRIYRHLADGLRVSWENASYSATESWVIFELARRDVTEVVELRRRTGIDSGYLSRVLDQFQADELIEKGRSPVDRRRQTVRLTVRGRAAFKAIDARAVEAVRARLVAFPESDRQRIIDAMASIRDALDTTQGHRPAI